MSWLPPSFQDLLLEEGTPFKGMNGISREAIGTGVVCLLGSARSGKTSMAYAIIDTVIRNSNRPISFVGFPDVVIEAMPEHWQGRVSNPENVEKLLDLKHPAVVLLDDTAVTLNSRDSMTKGSKLMSRLAGVISHIGGGLTVILTTQSMSGVDLSLLRYTQLAVGIRKISPATLWSERSKWLPRIHEAQNEIKSKTNDPNWRDLWWSMMDETLCVSWFPPWLDKRVDSEKADKLSRPFRYMSKGALKGLLMKPAGKTKKESIDNDIEA
jgi:hypothetical protein